MSNLPVPATLGLFTPCGRSLPKRPYFCPIEKNTAQLSLPSDPGGGLPQGESCVPMAVVFRFSIGGGGVWGNIAHQKGVHPDVKALGRIFGSDGGFFGLVTDRGRRMLKL